MDHKAALHLVMESMNVYPVAVRGGTNDYEQRTAFMEGWNAAVMEITRKYVDIAKAQIVNSLEVEDAPF
jgi:hypothetical protein